MRGHKGEGSQGRGVSRVRGLKGQGSQGSGVSRVRGQVSSDKTKAEFDTEDQVLLLFCFYCFLCPHGDNEAVQARQVRVGYEKMDMLQLFGYLRINLL